MSDIPHVTPEDLDRAALRMSAGRIRALETTPYYSKSMSSLIPIPREGLGKITVDSFWRVYYDPALCLKMSVDEIASEWIHVNTHVLRDHAQRFKQFSDTQHIDDWSLATDAVIYEDMTSLGLHEPKYQQDNQKRARAKYPEWHPGMTAEEMYRTAHKKKSQEESGDQPDPDSEDGAAPNDSVDDPKEDQKNQDSNSDSDSEKEDENSSRSENPDEGASEEDSSQDHDENSESDQDAEDQQNENGSSDDTDEKEGSPTDDADDSSSSSESNGKEDPLPKPSKPKDSDSSSKGKGQAKDSFDGPSEGADDENPTLSGSEDISLEIGDASENDDKNPNKEGDSSKNKTSPGDDEYDGAKDDDGDFGSQDDSDSEYDEYDDNYEDHEHDDSEGCGSGVDGKHRDYEASPTEAPTIDESLADSLRNETARDILSFDKSKPGSVPGNVKILAEKIITPEVNWMAYLRVRVRQMCAKVSGQKGYSYSKPNRRKSGSDFILPAMRGAAYPKVYIVLDTSGSMSKEDLRRALTEISEVIKKVRGKVYVIVCDAASHDVQIVSSVEEIELVGRGGTDMRTGMKKAAKSHPTPDMVMIFTDGGTPWPKVAPPEAPRAKYLALIISPIKVKETASRHKIPEFIDVVHVKN
jgi:predicted metal-dependent peptidase